jgi:hypothetical protein
VAISYTAAMSETAAAARRPRRALQAIVILVLWGLMTHGTFAGSGDEPHYLAIAHSIAFDGDLDLANNYGANEPLVGGGTLQPGPHVRSGAGGAARPVHDIGLPLLFAPFVRIAVPLTQAIAANVSADVMRRARLTPAVLYRHLLSLAMIVLSALLAGQMFDTFLAIGGSVRSAFGSALLFALSPPLLVFSILFFTELVSALLCLVLFRRISLVPTRGTRRWALVGTATGFLFLLHAKNIGLALPLAVLAWQTLRAPDSRRELGAFLAGLVAMIGVRTAVNYLFWGNLLTGPHAMLGGSLDPIGMMREIAVRLAGLLIDQEFGLLIYAPAYALALVGAVTLARDHPRTARHILGITAVYVMLILLPATNVHGWTGGWNPAARFLTPIVPLLAVLAFSALRAVPRALVVILLTIQIAIDVYAWQNPKILWNDGDGRAAICDRLGEAVCRPLPSLAR